MYYIFPIILIVASNVFYNICSKSTPQNANPFASLLVTYLTAAAATCIFLIIDCVGKGISCVTQFKNINWTGFVLGIAIIGLEVGYIQAYRAGWNISMGSLIANIFLAVILVIVGVLFYKEQIKLQQIIGIVLCIVGLIFISKK